LTRVTCNGPAANRSRPSVLRVFFTTFTKETPMKRIDFCKRPSRRLVLAALLLPTCLVGCGPGRGEVRGTVYIDGQPLASGTIQFLGIDGIPHAAAIRSDGTFAVEVPRGNAKVIVSCMNEVRMQKLSSDLAAARGGRSAPPDSVPEDLTRIPMRYAQWDTAGLTMRVASRKNYQDFYLTTN
jgi:hypothetical protein